MAYTATNASAPVQFIPLPNGGQGMMFGSFPQPVAAAPAFIVVHSAQPEGQEEEVYFKLTQKGRDNVTRVLEASPSPKATG